MSFKNGKLFVIDSGSDGSGKATQTKLLYDRLVSEGYDVLKVDYPNYKSDSSALVKMYLNGEFGSNADAINPYTASVFYSVDRIASFEKEWKEFYQNGGIILADRYTTSNLIHQTPKLETKKERMDYINWLHDLEYKKLGLPTPNQVFFLDVPVNITTGLMKDRANKINGSSKKDIHESNVEYLKKCYEFSCQLADYLNWKVIHCSSDGKSMRTIEDIHEEIYKEIKKELV